MAQSNIFDLSSRAPLSVQARAIKELALMDNMDPRAFLQPIDKDYWENAAKVLSLIGYPRIEVAIPGLLKWLQDLNWPGTVIVEATLKSLPSDILGHYLGLAIEEAIRLNDDDWLMNLSDLFLQN